MGQRIFTLALAVIVGVAIGVAVIGKNVQGPMMRKSLASQDAILDTLKRMEGKMGDSTGGLANKVSDLEDRLGRIEAIFKNVGQRPSEPQPPAFDYSKKYDIPQAHSYLIGKKDALVTVTAFMDFQCPYCSRFYTPFAQVLKEMPDKVNFILKNFPLPFHPNARPSAKFALAAGEQGKYAEVVDAVFANAQNLGDETYKKIAEQLKLDWNKIQADLKNNDAKYEEIITKDMNLGSQIGVQGTPTFYLNGKMTNARDAQSWKAEIEKAIQDKK